MIAKYGVLWPDRGYANRATFVVDKEGKIVHIEEGSGALDPTGAETACSRMAHKAQQGSGQAAMPGPYFARPKKSGSRTTGVFFCSSSKVFCACSGRMRRSNSGRTSSKLLDSLASTLITW